MKPHNPYVGPRAFQDGEALYGRDREVKKLLNLLIAERIVLLYSPSGAGKTSLVQAALMSELREEGFQVLPVIRVGLEPPPELERPETFNRYILSTLLSLEEGFPPDQQTPLTELVNMDLTSYLDQRLAEDNEADGDVLIFDQFEEILTVDPTDQAAKAEFFAQLGKAMRPRDRWALFAMREEYPAGLDPYLRPLPTRLSTTFRLELLGAKAARQAMQEPVRQAGVSFTDTAAVKLTDDLRRVQVQQPDGTTAERPGLYIEPVQLQVVCYRLWENLPEGATEIRETDIREAGDVDSALAGYYADRVKATGENTNVRERVIREWFDKHLITEQGIRGQVLRGAEQSQGLENRAIEPLVDAHLLRAENRRGAVWYELAHDRLVEPVRKDNAAWFEANLSPLQRQADLWQSPGRSGNLLLRDEALEEADHWAAEHENELTPVERDFLEACREARAVADARQAIAQAERERRKNRFIQVLAVVAVIFSIVAGYFYFQARQSEKAAIQSEKAAIQSEKEAIQAKNESLTQSVAFQSLFQHESGRDERAALLARQAYLFNQEYQISVLHQVDNTLRTALPQHFSFILEKHRNAVNTVAISQNGNRLVSGSDDETVRLWDLTDFDAEPEELPEGHTGRVWTVAVSPDGKIVASGSEDETVRWWVLTANSAMPQEPLKGHEGAVYSVAFSPDGKLLASGSSDETVHLWNLEDPSAGPIVLRGHEQGVNSVAFSPDGKILASGSDDMTVRLWDLEDPSASPVTLQGHEDKVYSVAFSRDGKTLASGSADNTIRLWKTQRPNAAPALLRGHEAPVRSLAFSSDGKTLASGSDDKTVRLWNPAYPSTSAAILRGHEKSVTSVVFSPDGHALISGSKDDTVRQWNRQPSGSAPIVLHGHTSTVWSLAFGPDGQLLSSISKDQNLLWDLQNPDTDPIEQREYEEAGYLVAFSPDGKTLASGGDDVRLWDLANPDEAPKTLEDHEEGHKDMVWSVAFSPDGKTLASGGDDVRLWDLTARDAKHKQTLKGHEGIVYAVAFSPDGRFLASGGRDKTVRLWDLTARNGKLTKSLQGHEGTVYALAFSPDSRLLASGSNDKTIRLWNLGNPSAAPIILRGHEQDVTSLAFSPDGEFLVSGSKDQTVRIWTWRTEILAEMVCKNVRHNLRLDEWCQFVSADLPYERTCSNLPPGEGATPGARCE